jgi:FemAB-related protein (PEP-CTERM system-associated)
MRIELLKNEDIEKWQEYVKECPESNLFHDIRWKDVIEKTFRYESKYLVAKEGEKIIGILPSFLIKKPIFGNKLVSLPFLTEAGIIADDEETEKEIIKEAIKITKENNAKYLEIRQENKIDLNLEKKDIYYNMILKLDKNPEIIWKKIDKKARNSTRKAIKSGIKTREGNVNEFYKVFQRNMRDLGTPVDKFSFFKNIIEIFPNQTKILVAEHKNKVIGALFLFIFKDVVKSEWASSYKEYRTLCPNNLLYWTAIEECCKKGFNYFNFGRSVENEGTYFFKKEFTSEPKRLYYRYYLNKAKKVPDTSKINPKRRIFTTIWKRVPLQIANAIGPWVREKVA